jgi:hypothetical protein
MREDSHYTLGNKLILIIPEESSCDYIRNRKFIQWQSTVLPISTIKSTVLPISTITSHLKVYTVTVNSSTNINNHLSPQGLYSDSQQFYQYQQSPLTSRFIQWQSTVLPISTITSHLTGHQNTTYYDENPGTMDRQEHKCGVVKSVNGNTRTIQNVY